MAWHTMMMTYLPDHTVLLSSKLQAEKPYLPDHTVFLSYMLQAEKPHQVQRETSVFLATQKCRGIKVKK